MAWTSWYTSFSDAFKKRAGEREGRNESGKEDIMRDKENIVLLPSAILMDQI